jgi:hypothetical protein
VRQATLVQVGLLTAQLINAAYNVMAQHILTKDGADPLVFSVYRDLAGGWECSGLAAPVRREVGGESLGARGGGGVDVGGGGWGGWIAQRLRC